MAPLICCAAHLVVPLPPLTPHRAGGGVCVHISSPASCACGRVPPWPVRGCVALHCDLGTHFPVGRFLFFRLALVGKVPLKVLTPFSLWTRFISPRQISRSGIAGSLGRCICLC